MLDGSCLCGAITFRADPVARTTACHCGQCRKQSGHYWSSGTAPLTHIQIEGPARWYAASPMAERGFCATCGSFLFWKAHDEDSISFSLGAIDGPTGLRLDEHIFTRDKGDYYDIAGDVPQRAD